MWVTQTEDPVAGGSPGPGVPRRAASPRRGLAVCTRERWVTPRETVTVSCPHGQGAGDMWPSGGQGWLTCHY